jgi:hypothetical protein
VATGTLLTPSSMDLFSDVKLPREFTDPFNFRLHPKGTANNAQAPQFVPIIKSYPIDSNDRSVTVHRIGDPQSLKFSLSNEFKVFYY